MNTHAALAEPRRGLPVPAAMQPRMLAWTVPRKHFASPWERILAAAGDLDEGSDGLSDPFLNVQMGLDVSEDVECIFINFPRFMCSEPVERYAAERGFVPAHPQSVALVANLLPSLPDHLDAPEGATLVSLVPCYRQEHESYVLGVSWDKDHIRTVHGLLYRYGWNPNHWFLFERLPVQAKR